MKILRKLAHYLFPRESNNQKAKLLHNSSLFLLGLFLLFYQSLLNLAPRVIPQILGYAANIAPSEVIRLTNEKRAAAGLSALTENSVLSQAAQAKGADMLVKGYWAHVSPDGVDPWKFFNDADYKYRYAGENLARDFSSPGSAVEAWMASPSHRENILSNKYKEIGIAVVEGSLAGVDTTIIVQFFGTKYSDIVPAPLAYARETEATTSASEVSGITTTPMPPENTIITPAGESGSLIKISPFNSTQKISLGLIALLLGVLVLDGLVVFKQKIARIGGRSLAHLAFLSTILVIILLLKAGKIL